MSLRGLTMFKEYFQTYHNQYVLIGGAACDLLFTEAHAGFRATKDFDLVLLVEALTPEFGKAFWSFIDEGGYELRARSNGMPQFYRFTKPKDTSFPSMIELFSRSDMALSDQASALTPIHIDDEVSSLSAILLDANYYALLMNGRRSVNDIVVLSAENLIPFKAKAWLDLSHRKAEGHDVSEKDIKKHCNDVCRLATLLTGDESCSLPNGVKQDMEEFLAIYREHPVDPKSLRIKGVTTQQILDVLEAVYSK